MHTHNIHKVHEQPFGVCRARTQLYNIPVELKFHGGSYGEQNV